MGKRCVTLYLALVLLFTAVSGRFVYLTVFSAENVSLTSSSFLLALGCERGAIYDCKGEPLVNEESIYYAAIAPDDEQISAVSKYLTDENRKALKSGKPTAVKVPKDFSADNINIFTIPERYADKATAAHIIGYLDAEKKGVFGIEKAFDEQLSGCKISVRFRRDAMGKILTGIRPEIIREYEADKGGKTDEMREVLQIGSVKLSIDKNIQQITQQAAERFIKTGAVVVLDNSNGRILSACSLPSINPNNLSQSLESTDTPFVNRALSPYSCGSVFKLCIGAAALECGSVHDHVCTGSEKIGNVKFGCLKKHGLMNLESAIAYSCNAYFISLGQSVGAENAYKTAKMMGFGAENMLCSGIVDAAGSLNSKADLANNPAALANFSFGQGNVMTTPLQIASMIQCIANGGRRNAPTLIESVTDKNRKVTEYESKAPVIVMSEEHARKLKSCMLATVKYGTGAVARPDNCIAGGKTATAQTGKYDKNGKEYLQAWFAGFIEKGGKSYTIAVMAENGITGGLSAAPVFKEIAEKI